MSMHKEMVDAIAAFEKEYAEQLKQYGARVTGELAYDDSVMLNVIFHKKQCYLDSAKAGFPPKTFKEYKVFPSLLITNPDDIIL